MKYHKVFPTRWHHFVVWSIQIVIGQAIANDDTDMNIERYLQRAKHLRRWAFRECAESRREMRRD